MGGSEENLGQMIKAGWQNASLKTHLFK